MLVAGCVSCHSVPPDSTTPGGGLSHSAHEAIAVISSDCFVCHEGKGSGSADHYDTIAPASIDIQSGYAEFDQSFLIGGGSPITCDNVRCHGGRTVTWTDSIDLNSDCACRTVGGSTFNRAKDKEAKKGVTKKGSKKGATRRGSSLFLEGGQVCS
jgi:predicted CxxxxCH...CXXCH cytochrome family protein